MITWKVRQGEDRDEILDATDMIRYSGQRKMTAVHFAMHLCRHDEIARAALAAIAVLKDTGHAAEADDLRKAIGLDPVRYEKIQIVP